MTPDPGHRLAYQPVPLPPGPVSLIPSQPVFPTPPPSLAKLRHIMFGGWGVKILLGVFLLMGVFFIGVAAWMFKRDHDYATRGVNVSAVVVDKSQQTHTDAHDRERTEYTVVYAFQDASGVRHQDSQSISGQTYGRLIVGGEVAAEYLSDDPSVSRLSADLAGGFVSSMAIIGLFWCLFAAMLYGLVRRRALRRSRVLTEGQTTPGQIVVSEVRGRGKYYRHVLTYRYIDLDGSEKMSNGVSTTAKIMKRLPSGSLITVCIDPADPKRPEPDLWGIRPQPEASSTWPSSFDVVRRSAL